MFDISRLEWPPPPVIPPPEDVIDDLVEEWPGVAEPVRWSEYLPDGMLADLLAQPPGTDREHREFEALERVGGWERVIAWAQARQSREMTWFMDSATVRNKTLGAWDSQAHDSAVAEVGLMLAVSARTAACRVGDAWSLCTRLAATLAALESGRITLAKARIIDAETLLQDLVIGGYGIVAHGLDPQCPVKAPGLVLLHRPGPLHRQNQRALYRSTHQKMTPSSR